MNEFLSAPTTERLVLALLHFLWQGTFLCLLYPVAINLNLLRTPRARYGFALTIFCLMALCPVLTFWELGPVSSPRDFNASHAIGIESAHAAYSTDSKGIFGIGFLSPQVVLAGWLIGVAYFSLRLIGGFRQLRRWRRDTLDPPPPLRSQVVTLCGRIGLLRIPDIKLSQRVTEAMAVGFWKPAILLPVSWATALPASTLEAIIAHELAHIRRFDLWINLGQRFVETMLFYHPAVWWLSKRIREERELCCDELAAQTTGECLGYALALEGVARYLTGSRTLLGASFLGDGKMKLLKRVRHVLGQPSSPKRKLWWPAGIMALMLPIGIYGTSLTAQDAPRERDRPRTEERRRDGDRPREAERERDRPRDGDRERARERDRERPPGDGDRPRREGERPRDGDRPRGERDRPRDGDRSPREGDRPRREGERDGDRPIRGDRERGERDLYREIELLREEVRRLREELRRRPGPPPGGGFFPPREGDRPLGPFGPPREGDRPRGEGERPRREGDRPPREGDRPRGDRPREEADIPAELRLRRRGRPPGEGEREERPDRPREGEREERRDRPREGERERDTERRGEREREERGERDREREERRDRPREREREERPERPETEVPAE